MEHLDGRLRTSEAGSLYFYTATAVYEIRLTAFFADNLMNSVAHCGGFYLRDIVEEKCRLRPACRKLPGLSREKTWITPRLSGTSGAQQRKNTNYAPLVGNFRGSAEKKCRLRPACRKLPGLNREKTWITPRLSETSGAQQRKNVDYARLSESSSQVQICVYIHLPAMLVRLCCLYLQEI